METTSKQTEFNNYKCRHIMKKSLSITIMIILMGFQMCYAQKNQTSDSNLQKAFELINENDAEGAIEFLDKQIEDNPKYSEAYHIRSIIYYIYEIYGLALTDINTSLKYWTKKNTYPKYHLYWDRAYIYEKIEEYDKAIDDYSRIYKIISKGNDIDLVHKLLYSRAEIYYFTGDLENSDADYNLVLKQNEADQVAMIGLARNMIKRGRYEDAIAMCNKCEKYDNTYEEIYHYRMQAYDSLGKTDLAIDNAILYYYYSEDYDISYIENILKKHLSYSLAKVNEIINNNSQNYVWRMFRAFIYEWQYDFVNAIAEYNSIEKEYGASDNMYYHKSQCYKEIGDYENAIKEITKCIETGEYKENYYIIGERADYHRKAGHYDKAIADFSKMIEIAPLEVYPYYKCGWCYELKGDDKTAMEYYNAGIDIDKEYPYIYLMRGEQYHKQGLKDLANADFEEILKLDTIVSSTSCRQYALHFLGMNDEAIEWMGKIIENDPENNSIYYDKSCLLSRMGKIDEAIAALRTSFEKGYRSFAHLENDDDMDNIRNHPDFIALINEYKDKTITVIGDGNDLQDEISVITEIEINKMYSSVYEVACSINGLPLKFIFDTGASSVTISSVEASLMLKNGYLTDDDIKGKEYFNTATGEIHEGATIRLREIKIGDAVLKNVEASVVHNQQAPLILGQSVLERFGTITIDNINSKLIIKQ